MKIPSAQLLAEIDAHVTLLEAADPSSAGPHWGAMHKLLLKAKADPMSVMRVVGGRDMAGLQHLCRRLRGEEDQPVDETQSQPARGVDPSVMHEALRLFKRRLALGQLDADSKLGVGPMSGGGGDRIQGIIPPREFPREVWEALVSNGKLRREGGGFYSLMPDGKVHW